MNKIIYRTEFLKMIKDDFIRPIPEHESYYASRDGDILSIKSYMNNGKIKRLVPFATYLGYHQITIDGKVTRKHQLIAKTFIPNPHNYPIINHKDENPANNCVDNLEWCTYKYNSNYGNAKVGRSKKVAQMDFAGNVIKTWDSIRDAARGGYVRYLVSDCANGKIKSYRKFIWKFI